MMQMAGRTGPAERTGNLVRDLSFFRGVSDAGVSGAMLSVETGGPATASSSPSPPTARVQRFSAKKQSSFTNKRTVTRCMKPCVFGDVGKIQVHAMFKSFSDNFTVAVQTKPLFDGGPVSVPPCLCKILDALILHRHKVHVASF